MVNHGGTPNENTPARCSTVMFYEHGYSANDDSGRRVSAIRYPGEMDMHSGLRALVLLCIRVHGTRRSMAGIGYPAPPVTVNGIGYGYYMPGTHANGILGRYQC